MPEGVLVELAQLRVKSFLANWVRLACLLAFLPSCKATPASGEEDAPSTHGPMPLFSFLRTGLARSRCFSTCHLRLLLDAAASWTFLISLALLGFCALLCLDGLLHSLTRVDHKLPKPPSKGLRVCLLFLVLVLSHGCAAGRPRAAYELKAAERAAFLLQGTRSVLPKTDLHRQARLADFRRWLSEEESVALEAVTSPQGISAEDVNGLLIKYGQDLLTDEAAPMGIIPS